MKYALGLAVLMTQHARAHAGEAATIVGRAEYAADQAAPATHELPADPGKDAYLVKFRPKGSGHDHTRWYFEHEIAPAPSAKPAA